MKKRSMAIVCVAIAVLSVCIFLSFKLTGGGDGGDARITLPQQGEGDIRQPEDMEKYNINTVEQIEISRENIKAVVASLRRPEQYSFTAQTEYRHARGSASFRTECWRAQGASRFVLYGRNGGVTKNILLTENHAYIWGSGGESFYKGSRGDFSEDDAGNIPTYEDIADLPDSHILEAGVTELESGEKCIFVLSEDPERGERTEWYVSIASGLLVRAGDRAADGTLHYEMNVTELAVGTVDAEKLLLPNGAQPE